MTAEQLAENVLTALSELQRHIQIAESQNIVVELRADVRRDPNGKTHTVVSVDMIKRLTERGPEVVVNVVRTQQPNKPHKWAGMDYSKVWPDGTKQPATYEDYCAYMGIPVGPNEKIGD